VAPRVPAAVGCGGPHGLAGVNRTDRLGRVHGVRWHGR
jgi:hypothetical protein